MSRVIADGLSKRGKDEVFHPGNFDLTESLLVNGHLRFDNYHDWTLPTQSLPMQRDIIADAVLYGWGGAPYEINPADGNTLLLEKEPDLPVGAVGKAIKLTVDKASPIDEIYGPTYHHHFRLFIPPERVPEIANAGGVYFSFWVKANHSATYSVTALNWARGRGYASEFSVDPSGWKKVELFYPLDWTEASRDGWLKEPTPEGDGFGVSFRILLGTRADSPYIATQKDAWVSGNILGTLVDDFGSNSSNSISFADFRAGVVPLVLPKSYSSDKLETLEYCYGHSAVKNSRSVLCQVNTGWTAELNVAPTVNFRKVPERMFVLGTISPFGGGTGYDSRFRDMLDIPVGFDPSHVITTNLPNRKFPLLRIEVPGATGHAYATRDMQASLRIPGAGKYSVDGIDTGAAGGIEFLVAPNVATPEKITGVFDSQQDLLDAIAAIPGIESATVDGDDIIVVSALVGTDSFIRVLDFSFVDPTEGNVNLLQNFYDRSSPPLVGNPGTYNLILQFLRSDVLGTLAGHKPLLYWDAVP